MSTTSEILHRIEALERENQELRDQINDQNNNEQLVGRRGILASLGLLLLPAAAAQQASADQAAEYACVWLGNQDANGFQLDDLDEINFSDGTTLGSASAVGSGALSDSGTDNPDGGDEYVLPQVEDSIDLQGSGDVENAASIGTEKATISDLSAVLEKTVDQAISANTDTTLDWDTQNVDTDLYSYNATDDTIDVLEAGDYTVGVEVGWQGLADQDALFVRFYVNGSRIRSPKRVTSATITQGIGFFHTFRNLSVNDTLRIDVRSTASNTVIGSAGTTYASITRSG